MFICPICGREYEEEEMVAKHFLSCWKEHNTSHISKEAPHSPDIEVRKSNPDAEAFFASFKKGE